MNCPMCGAPLGDDDFECSKCFTKRAEMGPMYNGAQGDLGAGNGGYNNANSGSFGSNNYAGSVNTYGSVSSTGASGLTSGQIAGVVIFVLGVLAAVFFIFIRPGTFSKCDAGYLTVKLPYGCEQTSAIDLGFDQMTEPKAFKSRDIKFECARLEPSYFRLEDIDTTTFRGNAIALLAAKYEDMTSFSVVSSAKDKLMINIDAGGKMYYAEIRLFNKGDLTYLAVCKCPEDIKSKVEPKFPKIFDSIKFK